MFQASLTIAGALLVTHPAIVTLRPAPDTSRPACVRVATDADPGLGTCGSPLVDGTAQPVGEQTGGPFPQSRARRPGALVPMYTGLIGLQGYDTYSTLAALKRGGVEANPLMRGIVGRPAVLIAVKGATTLLTIYTAERLWRQDRKVAAVAVMVASNGMLAVVAAHNASVLRRLR
jgi:hypothetical protein